MNRSRDDSSKKKNQTNKPKQTNKNLTHTQKKKTIIHQTKSVSFLLLMSMKQRHKIFYRKPPDVLIKTFMSCFNSLRFDLAIPDEHLMPYYTDNHVRTGHSAN